MLLNTLNNIFIVMSTKWISPKVVTGPAAIGDYYFKRPDLNQDIWDLLAQKTHVLLVAPRRVGKSSVMKDMENTPPDKYLCYYNDLEGTRTEDEFYQKILFMLTKCLEKNQTFESIKGYFKKAKLKSISFTSIEFENTENDLLAEIRHLLPQMKSLEHHYILFLDEFPEVLTNLKENGDTEGAKRILSNLREWRQNYNDAKILFVLAGSIGLHHVVSTIDRSTVINDLQQYKVEPLTALEANEFIEQATHGASVQYSKAQREELLNTIADNLPYHICLMLSEINRICRQNFEPELTSEIIQLAFSNIVKENKNFEDWESRLKKYHPNYFPFMNRILIHIAHFNTIQLAEIYNLAVEHKCTETYTKHLNILETDGYLKKQTDGSYKFISPFLKTYWKNTNPIYHG